VDATFFDEAEQAVGMLQNLQRFVRIETKRLDQQQTANNKPGPKVSA
jgi:hypothetical protein